MSFSARGFFEQGITASQVESEAEERSVEEAQRDIYNSHRHRIFSLAYHMTGNEIHAESLLKSSFVRAFSVQPQPDGNQVDKAFVTELSDQMPLTPVAPAQPSPTATLGGGNIRRTDLEEAVRELPSVERLVFLLRDVEGYSSEQAAALLEIQPAQVGKTLISARIRLRIILAKLKASREAA